MIEAKYRSLVPNSESDDKKKVYIEALDWALTNQEIKNIAITGAYGAGKSSIIQTYIKEKEIGDFVLPISIATFQEEKESSDINNGNNSLLENMLEQQILQQMFYKVKPDLIHKSRFISLSELSLWNIIPKISLVLFSILLTFIMIKESWISKSYSLIINFKQDLTAGIIAIILSLLGIFIYSYLLYQVFILINKIGLSKFKVGSTSIEFNFKDGSTVFNKYIEEIIYLFVKTNYNLNYS